MTLVVVSISYEFNACVCLGVCVCFCPMCLLAYFATNYIPPKQLNEQVNGVNSS